MRIFIDIDGVLARPDESAIARLCNDEWRLGIEEERLIQIKELNDFKAMPEVIARCGERDDTTFEFELGWMRFKPQAIRADIVLAGAVSGVRHLSQLGAISYCTARYSSSETWQEDLSTATQQWLEEQTFVNAYDVIFCNRIEGKLRYLCGIAKECDERLVLIDDSYPRILELIGQMSSADRELLCRRLVLVAMYTREKPQETHGMRVLTLRRWQEIDCLVHTLKEEVVMKHFGDDEPGELPNTPSPEDPGELPNTPPPEGPKPGELPNTPPPEGPYDRDPRD
ncbi:MAG TPA: hypothetical protein VKY19_18570 [Ktedonosporobacter sp.]|nr:hypothetical protein [Ktedonosporobacter sp.]